MARKSFFTKSLRELVFGLEDGLVSTLGVVTGMASGLEDRKIIILTGILVVFVEALSMSAGTYLSNKAESELEGKKNILRSSMLGATVMLFSYLFGGLVPVLPYFFVSVTEGIYLSIMMTMTTLFAVGFVKGKVTRTNATTSGFEMMIVSLTAALLGYIIGRIGSNILHIKI